MRLLKEISKDEKRLLIPLIVAGTLIIYVYLYEGMTKASIVYGLMWIIVFSAIFKLRKKTIPLYIFAVIAMGYAVIVDLAMGSAGTILLIGFSWVIE